MQDSCYIVHGSCSLDLTILTVQQSMHVAHFLTIVQNCFAQASLDHLALLCQVGDGVFEVLSTSGDTHLGGDDFDKRIVDFLADDFKQNEGIDLRKDRQVHMQHGPGSLPCCLA